MTNESESKAAAIMPVTVAMVGTGTGDGTAAAPLTAGTIARTPDGQPNIRLNIITPAVAIAVRFVNLFLTTLVGLLTAAGVGVRLFDVSDFQSLLVKSAWAGLIVAGMGLLKNLITIFARLEGKYPLATGSI